MFAEPAGLQNRQGGAALRLDGSIPSPLRGGKSLDTADFRGGRPRGRTRGALGGIGRNRRERRLLTIARRSRGPAAHDLASARLHDQRSRKPRSRSQPPPPFAALRGLEDEADLARLGVSDRPARPHTGRRFGGRRPRRQAVRRSRGECPPLWPRRSSGHILAESHRPPRRRASSGSAPKTCARPQRGRRARAPPAGRGSSSRATSSRRSTSAPTTRGAGCPGSASFRRAPRCAEPGDRAPLGGARRRSGQTLRSRMGGRGYCPARPEFVTSTERGALLASPGPAN